MANLDRELQDYLKAQMNVLLVGDHGTGKTSRVLDVAHRAGLKVKVFNAASMDPFTDLVGVPKFTTDDEGREVLVSVRPRAVDDADFVFIDELNRAGDPKITNAVFEMIQFGSINGEKLPNLKCVWAAINPPDSENNEYDVQPLDPALVDRFHVTMNIPVGIDRAYFTKVFGPKVAHALSTWWNGISDKRKNYVSPRRLETIGKVFLAIGTEKSLADAMPPGNFEVKKLHLLLKEATMSDEEIARREKDRKAIEDRLVGRRVDEKIHKKVHSVSDTSVKNFVQKVNAGHQNAPSIRRYGPDSVAAALAHPALTPQGRKVIVNALVDGISPIKINTTWAEVYNTLTLGEFRFITQKWSSSKLYSVRREQRSGNSKLVQNFF